VHGQLAREFAEKAMKLDEETEFEQAAQRLIDLACSTMRCDHAGLLLVHDGVLETLDATDSAVEKADQLENELHEGPSLAASFERDLYRIDDTLADDQWPRWSSGAAALGLRSVLSARLPMAWATTGALTMYGDQPSRFSEEAGAVVRVIIQHAAAVARTAHEPASVRGPFET
jgi:transcriptional regulator with GAF, ATPase, and Fis domain